MGAVAGAALGLGVAMMADDGLPEVARWIILGVLVLAGATILPFLSNSGGMIVATCIAGSFLLFLGIDLLVNEINGMSRGLRYMLDGNSAHVAELIDYHPPVTTRVLLAVSWAVAVLFCILQWLFWISRLRQPFIRQVMQLKSVDLATETNGTLPPDFASDYRLPVLPPGLSDEFSVQSPTPMGDEPASLSSQQEMQERYRLAVADPSPEPYIPETRGTSPLLPTETLQKIEAIRRHPSDLSHPELPPSRPASVVSSSFASALRSRPPTFFDESVRTPPLAPRFPPQRKPTPPFPSPSPVNTALPPTTAYPPLPSPTASTYVTQNIPIFSVPAVALTRPPSSPRRPSIPTSIPVGPNSEDGASVTRPQVNRQTKSSGELTVGGQAARAFAAGLQAGEAASLPATRNSSGNDISTLLGGGFDTPTPPPSRSQVSYFAPLSPTAGAPSTNGDDRSFATAESTTEYDDFPSTPTEVRALSPATSVVRREDRKGSTDEDVTEQLT